MRKSSSFSDMIIQTYSILAETFSNQDHELYTKRGVKIPDPLSVPHHVT